MEKIEDNEIKNIRMYELMMPIVCYPFGVPYLGALIKLELGFWMTLPKLALKKLSRPTR